MNKKLFSLFAAAVLACASLLSGCFVVESNERDIIWNEGKDGQDLTIDSIYESVNKEREQNGELPYPSLSAFLQEYLHYTPAQLEEATSFTATVNRSLRSGVAILSTFNYTKTTRTFGWGTSASSKVNFSSVYCGSGAIVDLDKTTGDAIVVTNCHVVYDSQANEIICPDVRLYLYGQDTEGVNFNIEYGQTYTFSDMGTVQDAHVVDDGDYAIHATVIGAVYDYDVAVLKISGSEILKKSDAVKAYFSYEEEAHIGESVYTVGNPYGYGLSVTSGIISRDSEYINLNLNATDYSENMDDYRQYRVIRTDAAVNGGNSGGALFNTQGTIVGVINSGADPGELENFNFALPASSVRRLVNKIVSHQNGAVSKTGISKAYLGVVSKVVHTSAYYDEPYYRVEEYIMVDSLVDGGLAQNYLEEGDRITGFAVGKFTGNNTVSPTPLGAFAARNSYPVTRSYQLSEYLLEVEQGDTICLTVTRNGQTQYVYLTFTAQNFKTVN